jgi:hypothetical protein
MKERKKVEFGETVDEIIVYTVGFQIGGEGSTAYQTLKQCASSPDKFFNAEDGVKLRDSFTAIAQEIATLSLSQ